MIVRIIEFISWIARANGWARLEISIRQAVEPTSDGGFLAPIITPRLSLFSPTGACGTMPDVRHVRPWLGTENVGRLDLIAEMDRIRDKTRAFYLDKPAIFSIAHRDGHGRAMRGVTAAPRFNDQAK